jgi:hypothetical protein
VQAIICLCCTFCVQAAPPHRPRYLKIFQGKVIKVKVRDVEYVCMYVCMYVPELLTGVTIDHTMYVP